MGLFDIFKKKNKDAPKATPGVTFSPEFCIDSDSPSFIKLLNQMQPSSQGLYPHEILMLHYAEKFTNHDDAFPLWWESRYSVTSPRRLLHSLFNRGFLALGGLENALERLTTKELKEELSAAGLNTNGKKAELIERLLGNVDHKKLAQKHPEQYFVLTDYGAAEIAQNPYVIYQHKHPNYLSIYEMNVKLSNNPKELSYKDIQRKALQKNISAASKADRVGLYRMALWHMYEFSKEEDSNDYKAHLRLLCGITAWDLSDIYYFDELENGSLIQEINNSSSRLKWKIEHYFPYQTSCLKIHTAQDLATLQSQLGMSDEKYREAIIRHFERLDIPDNVFTRDECIDIIFAEMHNQTEILEAVYNNAQKRMQQKYDQIVAEK